MKNFIILLKKDLTALWRLKKVFILGVIFTLFGLLSPITAYYMPEIFKLADLGISITLPEPTILDSYLQLFNNLGQICLFILVIIYIPEIVNERRKGQFTTLVNNNVSKAQFVLAKIISQLIIFSLIFLFCIACFVFYNLILFEEAFLQNSLLSFSSLYVYFLFAITLSNFFSSFSKNTTMAMLLSFAVLILMPIFSFFKFGKYLPSALPELATAVLDSDGITNAYQTMAITIFISFTLVIFAIKLCNNKD